MTIRNVVVSKCGVFTFKHTAVIDQQIKKGINCYKCSLLATIDGKAKEGIHQLDKVIRAETTCSAPLFDHVHRKHEVRMPRKMHFSKKKMFLPTERKIKLPI